MPINEYSIRNIPNIEYCSADFFSDLNFAVNLTIAFPNPKSNMVKYAIIEATREYSPNSDCPNFLNMNGI